MKRCDTLVAVILAIALIFSLSASAVASVDEVLIDETRSSEYLRSYNVAIFATGNDKMKVSFSVAAKRTMDYVGVWEIEIEKKVAGSWTYDRTLSHEEYSNFLKTNSSRNNSEVIFNGVRGVEYQATITAYAADSNGSDSKLATSFSATCY